jgi:hypothetical protein
MMLSWKFRGRRQGKKLQVFKRNSFADQLASIVESDDDNSNNNNNNYDEDSTIASDQDNEQTMPLVRFLPSGMYTLVFYAICIKL